MGHQPIDCHRTARRIRRLRLRPTSPPRTLRAERWKPPSTNSRPTNAAPKPCRDPSPPELVLHKIRGHLFYHYALRTLMWEAAERADPDRAGFVTALHIARRSRHATYPLRTLTAPTNTPSPDSAANSNPHRQLQTIPCLIKRKRPKWHVKRARYHNWTQFTEPPTRHHETTPRYWR